MKKLVIGLFAMSAVISMYSLNASASMYSERTISINELSINGAAPLAAPKCGGNCSFTFVDDNGNSHLLNGTCDLGSGSTNKCVCNAYIKGVSVTQQGC